MNTTPNTSNTSNTGSRETSRRLAADYGVRESNPLWTSEATHENVDYSEGDVPLSDPRLVRIVRLRLLTEAGYPGYDVSYCYGQLSDGRFVRVDLGASFLSRRTIKADLIGLAKEAGRFAKGLGLLDDVNVWSILR